ncbi:MAG: hypothetical protein IT371_03755 [Deltaproteobacteria bacterium]|nr:hypothetical protein [Deltaproteobacteria bacterium]
MAGHRELKAIVFTDIAGFSRMMARDEAATVASVKEHREIVRRALARHGGREHDTAGDAFMVLFDSAVDAVACAVELQDELAARNAERAPGDELLLRIGIHLGDILVDEGHVYGDGVNIAARVEPLAEPGGICLTQEVYSQVRGKLTRPVTSLGPRELKNLPYALHLYQVGPTVTGGPKEPTVAGDAHAPRGGRRSVFWAGAALLVALALAAGGFLWLRGRRGPARPITERSASREANLLRPARGGVLRVAYAEQLGTFDLFAIVGKPSREVMALLSERLTAQREGEAPGPLERLEESEGGRALALTLRAGLRFHDHPCFAGGRGREATAADLRYSIEVAMRHRMADLPALGAAAFRDRRSAHLAGLREAGPRSVVIALERALPYAAELLTGVRLVPRELEGCEDLRNLKHPVGTGPFRFVRQKGGTVRLDRFAEYWRRDAHGERLPYLDGVEYVYRPDPLEAFAQLARGELQLLPLERGHAATLLDQPKTSPALKARFSHVGASVVAEGHQRVAGLYGLVVYHRKGGALDRPAVRRAVSYALARDRLAKLCPVRASPSGRILQPHLLGYDPELPELASSHERAAALLAAAGHPGGRGLPELAIGVERLDELALELKRELGAVGFKVRLVELSTQMVEDSLKRPTFDALFGHLSGSLVGWDPFFLLGMFGAAFRQFGYENPAVSALVERVAWELNADERVRLYRRLERRLLEDLPMIPVAAVDRDAPVAVWVVEKRLRGFGDPLTGRLLPGALRGAEVFLAPATPSTPTTPR